MYTIIFNLKSQIVVKESFSLKADPRTTESSDVLLSGKMIAIATGPTNSNQLAVSDNSPVKAAVPLTDQPIPEASQAPPKADSKYGKTNLTYLKDKLQHLKEITRAVAQTSGVDSHPWPNGVDVNYEIPVQDFLYSTNKVDLTNFRSRLEKIKEEREKAMAAGANKKSHYYNLFDYRPENDYRLENPVMLNNPADKKPVAGPRTKAPANIASSNTHSASSKRTYRLWQCAQCQEISEAQYVACKYCMLPRGKMADRSKLCDYCQLMMFIPAPKGVLPDVCCPRCKQVYESAC